MPTALVTGATAGLGAEFARELAGRGFDLVLVARDVARIEQMATELRTTFAVSVEELPADLIDPDGLASVVDRVSDDSRPLDLLVNNAGLGTYQPFGAAQWAMEEQQLDLNVRAVLKLSHAAVPGMKERGSGRILNVSSVAGFVPRAGNATYSASKAWVTMFSEALSLQLAGSGVSVTAVCPGFTRTEFHERASADMSHVPEGMWLDPVDVVHQGLEDLFANKPVSVPTRRYKTLVQLAQTVPRPVLRAIMARRGL